MDKKIILLIFVVSGILVLSLFYSKQARQNITPLSKTKETTDTIAPVSLVFFFEPTQMNFQLHEIKTLTLKARVQGNPGAPITHLTAQVYFPNALIRLPPNHYVDTSSSPFAKINRIDGPKAANETGTIAIDLETRDVASLVKMRNGDVLTLARIELEAMDITTLPQTIRIENIEVFTNKQQVVPATVQNVQFSIVQ